MNTKSPSVPPALDQRSGLERRVAERRQMDRREVDRRQLLDRRYGPPASPPAPH